MKFKVVAGRPSQVRSDIAALFVPQDKESYNKSVGNLITAYRVDIQESVLKKDFSAKENESHLLYTSDSKQPRLLLVGIGEGAHFTLEKLRRASAAVAKKARSLKSSTLCLYVDLHVILPDATSESVATAITEGIVLSLYTFDKYLSSASNRNTVSSVTFIIPRASDVSRFRRGILRGEIIAAATNHARDLANAPGSEIYPETLANNARQVGKKSGVSVTVFNDRKIKQLRMGGVIDVSKGSVKKPRFIILEYGKKYRRKGTAVLVGKGVTFDTGGISIKPSASMAEMKMDMSGAAAVIGTFRAIGRLKPERHVVGLIPAVENMPSGSAVKPGDIIRHYNGKTSEVDNTDAEGRLILADALSYAARYTPDVVIDLATLTGAVVVSLGHFATGMMGNDQPTMDALRAAGERTYERVWQLPMFDEYEKLIKSDVADVKNVGGRWAGAITAGFFLKKFIGDYKWVHLDIAGTAILESDQEYIPKGGSGVGVRLLVEFLMNNKR
jgi:leucyl aminopeptidase